MQTKDVATLSEMYHLFARVDGMKVLCAAFKEYVQVRKNFRLKSSY